MTLLRCDKEQKVLEAVQSGSWHSSLRQHMNQCSICEDLMLAATFLRGDATAEDTEVQLPSADLIWWKAQLRARQAALERATRPIHVVTEIGALASAAAALWLVYSSSHIQLSQVQNWIAGVVRFDWLSHSPYVAALTLLTALGTIVCTVIGSFISLRS